jgi:hemerythrin superfamily protein
LSISEEHATVKKLVWKAEHSASNSENYDTILTDAVNAFLEHAVEEETTQFPKLRERLGPEQNDVSWSAFI